MFNHSEKYGFVREDELAVGLSVLVQEMNLRERPVIIVLKPTNASCILVVEDHLGKIGPVNNVTVQLSVCTLREADMSASGTDRAVRKPKRYSSDTPLLKRLIPSKVPGFCI